VNQGWPAGERKSGSDTGCGNSSTPGRASKRFGFGLVFLNSQNILVLSLTGLFGARPTGGRIRVDMFVVHSWCSVMLNVVTLVKQMCLLLLILLHVINWSC
jgi:hypothetical protein